MAKVLEIGDLHFSPSNTLQTETLYLEVQKLLKLRNDVDIIVLLGDVVDKEKIDSAILNRVRSLLTMLASYRPVTVLVGNHERRTNDIFLTEDHILRAFVDMKGVTVVDKPITTDVATFCPYVPVGRFLEALGCLGDNWKSSDVIYAHQEFAGADFGTFISKSTEAWGNNLPPVRSGHIHKSQQLQNVRYVGTPYEVGFGEGDRKTISIYDTFTKKEEIIDLNIPRKITVEVDIADIKDLKIPDDNNFYRITISGDEEKVQLFKKTKGYQKLNERHKVIIKGKKLLTKRKNSDNLDFISFLRKSVATESKEVNDTLNTILERMSK